MLLLHLYRSCFIPGIAFCGEVCGAAVEETVCVFVHVPYVCICENIIFFLCVSEAVSEAAGRSASAFT